MTKFFITLIAAIGISSMCYAAPMDEPLPSLDPRNAFEVSYSDAEEAISQALTEKGVGDKVSAKINGHKLGAIFAYTKPMTVKTRGLQFDNQNGRWSANLIFEADGEVITALPASGHYEEMIEVPVLKREVRNGDTISEGDIEIRDFALNHTRNDTVNDLSSLIGKTPLRSISPYRPIRMTEIVNPSIIKKDAIVQMRYTSPGMEITTSGQTMNAGAKGDIINVRNVASKRIVRAMVESGDTVTILSPTLETSQLTGDTHATN